MGGPNLYAIDGGGDDSLLLFVGTCQWCGMYWDVRHRKACTCGGEIL